METLEKSFKYTKEKKEHQLKKLEKTHNIGPKEKIDSFIHGVKCSTGILANNIDRLSSWNLWKYLKNYLVESNIDIFLLSQSTYYGYYSNILHYSIGQSVINYDICIPFRLAIMHLGQMLFLSWDDKAIKYGNLLLSMLQQKYYKGGTKKPLYSWFILSLFCKWQNIELKIEGLKIPDNLGVYQQALDNLHSKDMILISRIIEELSINHIKNSDEYVITDEYGNEESAEFSSSDYFLFPIEILMFLGIRKRLGLPDYNITKNELLSLPINKIPNQVVAYPQHDIIDGIFDKLYKENPDYPRF